MSPPVVIVAVWVTIDAVLAPVALRAIPRRYARRLEASGGAAMRMTKWLARPVPAPVVQVLSLVVLVVVVASVGPASPSDLRSVAAVGAAALVAGACLWTPIVGPWPALRAPVPSQLALLVVVAIEPLVAAAMLAGVGAASTGAADHEAAVLLLVVGGTLPPVVVAAVILVGWVRSGGPAGAKALVVSGRDHLTVADVHREFDRLGPARHREAPSGGPPAPDPPDPPDPSVPPAPPT